MGPHFQDGRDHTSIIKMGVTLRFLFVGMRPLAYAANPDSTQRSFTPLIKYSFKTNS
jgi:hypothetical protein